MAKDAPLELGGNSPRANCFSTAAVFTGATVGAEKDPRRGLPLSRNERAVPVTGGGPPSVEMEQSALHTILIWVL